MLHSEHHDSLDNSALRISILDGAMKISDWLYREGNNLFVPRRAFHFRLFTE